jgi:hypothetical protein
LGDLGGQHRVGVAGEDHEIRGLNLHGVPSGFDGQAR